MALRSLAKRYSAIKKPSSSTGQSSYFSTLAKRTTAAEDDIEDHNYEVGLIDAQTYVNSLTKRLARTYLTPLQKTNINQKIEKVQEDYNDSIVQNRYKAGEITDRQMYEWEKSKLEKMTATDSTAYQAQSAKVQGLLDKAQKSERKDYRVSEMNRISKLPEDTSQRLSEKAALYLKLRDQALADGDSTDASTLDTTYNNYKMAADKAVINDQVTAMNQNVAAASENIPYNTDGTPVSGEAPVPSGQSGEQIAAAGGTGVSTGAESDAVRRAQESYQRAITYGKNLDQDIRNTQTRIDGLKEAQKKYKAIGAVDSAAALETQITNLQNRLSDLKDAKAGNGDTIAEAKSRIGEATTAAAYKGGYTQLQTAENTILDAEQNVELMLQMGKLNKQEYLDSRREIIRQKAELYKEFVNLYDEFDKTNPSADMARKAQREEMQNLRAINMQVSNAGRFELVQDTDGVVKLKDVYMDKEVNRTLEQDYVKTGGTGPNDPVIFRKVIVPGVLDENGNPKPVSQITKEQYAQIFSGDPNMAPFVVGINGDGTIRRDPVVVVDGKARTMESAGGLIDQGRIVQQPDGTYKSLPEAMPAKPVLETFKPAVEAITKNVAPVLTNIPQQVSSTFPGIKNVFENAKGTVTKLLKNLENVKVPTGQTINLTKSPMQTALESTPVQSIFQKAKDFGSNLLEKLLPQKVMAASPAPGTLGGPTKITNVGPTVTRKVGEVNDLVISGTPQIYRQSILDAAKREGIPASILSALLASESSWNPRAISPAGAVGLAQFMPGTARAMGINPYDATQSIYGAAKYLKRQLDSFGNMDSALAAYNAGPNAVSQYGGIPPYEETQNYVAKIKKLSGYAEPTPTPRTIDATSVQPIPTQTPWYKKIIPQVSAAEPARASTSTPSIKPPMSTPNFSTPTPAPSAQPRMSTPAPAPSISLPKIPSYNPIQTFQSNVSKIANVAQQAPKAVQSFVQTVAQKAQPVVQKVTSFISNLFKRK